MTCKKDFFTSPLYCCISGANAEKTRNLGEFCALFEIYLEGGE